MINLSISETVGNIFKTICDGIAWVINSILSLLPDNPFDNISVPSDVTDILHYLNYFLPVKAIIVVLGAWLGAIVAIMLYKLVVSFFKLIGG